MESRGCRIVAGGVRIGVIQSQEDNPGVRAVGAGRGSVRQSGDSRTRIQATQELDVAQGKKRSGATLAAGEAGLCWKEENGPGHIEGEKESGSFLDRARCWW